MKNLPPELVFLLIFGAIMLFNYVMRQASRRRQEESTAVEPVAPAPDEPLERIFKSVRPAPAAEFLPVAPPALARVSEAQPVAAAVPRRHSGVRSLLRGRRNLRRAYVVMTVLGPCRALGPNGALPGGAAAGTSPGRPARSGGKMR